MAFLQSHLDGVNLDAVAQRYFSLTKDETVSTSITVAKGIKVEGKVVTDAVEVGGLVSWSAWGVALLPVASAGGRGADASVCVCV